MFIALSPYLVKLVTFDIILVLLISLCKVKTLLKCGENLGSLTNLYANYLE